MNNMEIDLEGIDFKNRETIARDFYLKCSTTSQSPKKELNADELLIALENKNLNYFDKEKIEQFRHQLKICKETKKPEDFNKWLMEFKNYDFNSNNKYKYIAKTLGAISWGLHQIKTYRLREAQVLAILIFIDNHEKQESLEKKEKKNQIYKNEIIENKDDIEEEIHIKDKTKGIIEEISTGEGKSAIIVCLAAFFGLRNRIVDIITSSRTLAFRDSVEFKEFFSIFNLTVDYVSDYQPAPYKADIAYGTFLDFEGDFLEELTSNKSIRGDRPYDIVIIDEVDNAFIDCIQGSTQLTHSSKGYQFLIPIYLSVYLLIDLLDRFYMEACMKQYEEIFKQEEFKNLNEESKKNILEQITSDYDRKDIFLKYAEKIFEDLKGEMINKNPKNAEFYKGENGDFKKNIQKLEEAVTTDPIISLKKSVGLPRFLEEFARIQMEFWANSAFCAKNLFKRETDYTISNATGNEAITPIDRKNTGELEFNTVYQNGLHQMLQIKENLRVKPETLTHTFLSHITYFIKFKKKNFFGLTGTIGGPETYSIYQRKSFNSNLVFIPSY